ncbi:hypothetical protein MY11210_004153 [Beauveria gryllotalpidicola]
MFEINRHEVSVQAKRPFELWMEADSWARYKGVMSKMICIIYRTKQQPREDRPLYAMTDVQNRYWKEFVKACTRYQAIDADQAATTDEEEHERWGNSSSSGEGSGTEGGNNSVDIGQGVHQAAVGTVQPAAEGMVAEGRRWVDAPGVGPPRVHRYREKNAREYGRLLDRFRAKLLILMRMVGGQPARATEILTIRDGEHGLTGGPQHIRKPRADVFRDGVPQEFPADRPGQDDPPVHAARGGRVVSLVHVVGVAIAITNRYLGTKHDPSYQGEDGEDEDEDEDGIDDVSKPSDLQGGHTWHIAGMVYAREMQEVLGGTALMREKFRGGGAGQRDGRGAAAEAAQQV